MPINSIKKKLILLPLLLATIQAFPWELQTDTLRGSTQVLDSIVIEKRFFIKRDLQTAQTAILLTRDFLEANKDHSLMQTLSRLPGINHSTIGNSQSKPIVRGLGANRVTVLQQGIKHEAQEWGEDHGLEIPQEGIQSIEIIKGAGAIAYGSDAMGGVINIKNNLNSGGFYKSKGYLTLFTSNNSDLYGVNLGLQKSQKKWSYKTTLGYKSQGDYRVPTSSINYQGYIFELHENRLRNTAAKELSIEVQNAYQNGEFTLNNYLSHHYNKGGLFANIHGLEVRNSTLDQDASSRDILYPHHQVNHTKWISSFQLLAAGNPIDLTLAYQNNYRQEHAEPVPHGYMPKPAGTLEKSFTKNTFTANLLTSYKVHRKVRSKFGVNTTHQINRIGGWGFLIPDYNRSILGVFTLNSYPLSPEILLEFGARYEATWNKSFAYKDWFESPEDENGDGQRAYIERAKKSSRFFQDFSPSIGARYSKQAFDAKVNLSKSFRVPLAHELAANGLNYHMYRYEKGNQDLSTETSYHLDGEFHFQWRALALTLSPFLSYSNNYIYLNHTPTYYQGLQVFQYTQNSVLRRGGELMLSYYISSSLELSSGLEYIYTRQQSGDKSGYPLPLTPPPSGLFAITFTRPLLWRMSNFRMHADYRIAASQNDILPPELATPGYSLVDLSCSSDFSIGKDKPLLTIALSAKNVLNKKYFNHTSFYRMIEIPEAGRNISLSLTVNLNN